MRFHLGTWFPWQYHDQASRVWLVHVFVLLTHLHSRLICALGFFIVKMRLVSLLVVRLHPY